MSWIVVWGTRPELTKLHSVVTALRDRFAQVEVWHTGQHTDLVTATIDSVALRDLVHESVPLRVGRSEDPGVYAEWVAEEVARRLSNLTTVCHGVIVQGDTGSAYGAAMGAHRSGVPVAHVEAGVRSHDPSDPFPEETFRVGIDRIARWHLAPTTHCEENLLKEGIFDTVTVTGNTGIDALWHDFTPSGYPYKYSSRPGTVLMTLHRRERWSLMGELAHALDKVAEGRPEKFIWPAHPNPVIRLATAGLQYIQVRPPFGHHAFREALVHADLVITDSGGVQEEAAALGTPCLVVRKVTDRQESVAEGHAKLVGTDPDTVALAVWNELTHPTLKTSPFPGYGNGTAGIQVARALLGR